MNAKQQPAVAGQVEPTVRRYPLELVCLHSDDCRTLVTKGHHDADEFLRACAKWNDGPIKGWGRVRHGWHRTVPDASGEANATPLDFRDELLRLAIKAHNVGIEARP